MVYRNRCIALLLAIFSSLIGVASAQPDNNTGWWYADIASVREWSEDPQALCDQWFALYQDPAVSGTPQQPVAFAQTDFSPNSTNTHMNCWIEATYTTDGPFGNIGDLYGQWVPDVWPMNCQPGEVFDVPSKQCVVGTCDDFAGESAGFGPGYDCASPAGSQGLLCQRQFDWPGSCPDSSGQASLFNYACATWTWTANTCTLPGTFFPPGDPCPGGGELDAFGICEWTSDDDPPPCPGNTVPGGTNGHCVCPPGQEWVVAGQVCATPDPPDPDPPDDPDPIPPQEPPDTDDDGNPDNSDPDVDGDGTPNHSDPDVDGDGIPNDDDPDIDGDGIPNDDDASPDGAGQNPDGVDCPPGTTYQSGYCQCDGADEVIIGDRCVSSDPGDNNTDTDGDGIPDGSDPDIDGDGIPNDQDPDSDGDGVPNDQDDQQTGPGSCPANYVVHQVNEETSICVPNPTVSVGSCNEAPVCQGDQTDCAVITLLHENNCQWDADTSDIQDAIAGEFASDQAGFGDPDQVDGGAALNIGTAGSSCPAFPNITVLGESIPIDAQPICDLAKLLSPIVIILSLVAGGRIVYGGLTV